MGRSSRTAPAAIVAVLVLLGAFCARAGAATETGTGVIDEPQPCFSLCEPPPKVEDPPPTDPAHTILIVSVGWDTGIEATSTGFDYHRLQPTVDYYAGKLNQWYAAQDPDFIPWSVRGAGEFMIAPPHFPSSDPAICGDQNGDKHQFVTEVIDHAEAALRKAGINPDPYWDVVIQFERRFCDVAGITRGNRTLISYLGSAAPMHELGHYLGLDHAERLRCLDSSGHRVTLSDRCPRVEYGDQYDTMGKGTGAFNALLAHQLGWLRSGEFTELSAGPYTQTVTLKPWTGGARDHRALRLTDGINTFWFEYRNGTGIDAYDFAPGGRSYVRGVVVHREVVFNQDGGQTLHSQLLDMNPDPAFPDGENAPLTPGKTWVNPLGSMAITDEGRTEDGSAILKIAWRFVAVPDVVGGDRKTAIARIGAAGLHFAGSTNVKTSNCDEVGKVIATVPPVGTGVDPGSDVTVSLGEGNLKTLCQ